MTTKIVGPRSPLGDEALRQRLINHLKSHPHMTTAQLVRRMGASSRPALDLYIKGDYFKPKQEGGQGVNPKGATQLEAIIRDYLDRVEGTESHAYSAFANTQTWRQVQKGIEVAIDESAIVVIYGPPGVGKSRSLLQFKVERMVSDPLEVLCSRNVSVKYFIQAVAKQLGIDGRASIPTLEDQVAEKLKRLRRPLVVDQANFLREESLGTCCHLWEVARIPIVLFGTRDLYDLFMSTRLTQDVRAQLSSRVKMHFELTGLTIGEAKSIMTAWAASPRMKVLPPGADAPEVIAEALKQALGLHRNLEFLLDRATELGEEHKEALAKGEITWKEIIIRAANRLMSI